jgi:addiction module HigA family antidote
VEIVDDHQEQLMARNKLPPTTPGEVLLEEFLKPLEVSQYQLAKDVGVPPRRINEIVLGKRAVTADTALRLARYFGTSERFWLNIQTRHDLEAETVLKAHRDEILTNHRPETPRPTPGYPARCGGECIRAAPR